MIQFPSLAADSASPYRTGVRRVLLRLAELQGWRRNLALFVVGVISALAFPPFGIFIFLMLGASFLLLLLDRAATSRRAFADGWWFAYGIHVAGIYWIAISLLVDADRFAWMIPFAVFGLTAVVAVYGGIASYIAWRIPFRTPLQRVILFTLSWVGVEMLRGWMLTGFPWNLAGNALSLSDIGMQAASIFSVYGLSLIVIFCGALFAWPYLRRETLMIPGDSYRSGWSGLSAAVLVFGAVFLFGAARLTMAPEYRSPLMQQPNTWLRLVQPAIPQSLKWDPQHARETVLTHLKLSSLYNSPAPTHIIWPEAALPFRLAETPPLVADIASVAPRSGWVVTGGTRVTRDEHGEALDIYNAIELVESDGALRGLYDKIKLVPFGEFVPMRSILPIDKITPGSRDFSVGKHHGPIGLPGLPPAAPLICYEVIFPDFARSQSASNADEGRAQWLLNLTNDAWFGTSSGPYQHFGMARMRAVELGLPLVRVANSGITAITDPYGRVLDELPLNARGVLDVPLPKPLAEPTLYGRYGYLPLATISLLLATIAGLAGLRRRRAR
jgi:apolipoprotein N-acyltransferase